MKNNLLTQLQWDTHWSPWIRCWHKSCFPRKVSCPCSDFCCVAFPASNAKPPKSWQVKSLALFDPHKAHVLQLQLEKIKMTTKKKNHKNVHLILVSLSSSCHTTNLEVTHSILIYTQCFSIPLVSNVSHPSHKFSCLQPKSLVKSWTHGQKKKSMHNKQTPQFTAFFKQWQNCSFFILQLKFVPVDLVFLH